jgi:hypothetical protein
MGSCTKTLCRCQCGPSTRVRKAAPTLAAAPARDSSLAETLTKRLKRIESALLRASSRRYSLAHGDSSCSTRGGEPPGGMTMRQVTFMGSEVSGTVEGVNSVDAEPSGSRQRERSRVSRTRCRSRRTSACALGGTLGLNAHACSPKGEVRHGGNTNRRWRRSATSLATSTDMRQFVCRP